MRRAVLACLLALAPALVSAEPKLADLRWRERVVLVAAPSASDPNLIRQLNMLEGWSRAAADRDVRRVEIVADRVDGVSDPSSELRRRLGLPSGAFQTLLIGKDGRVVLRSSRSVTGDALQAAIDAMPMRRAGER